MLCAVAVAVCVGSIAWFVAFKYTDDSTSRASVSLALASPAHVRGAYVHLAGKASGAGVVVIYGQVGGDWKRLRKLRLSRKGAFATKLVIRAENQRFRADYIDGRGTVAATRMRRIATSVDREPPQIRVLPTRRGVEVVSSDNSRKSVVSIRMWRNGTRVAEWPEIPILGNRLIEAAVPLALTGVYRFCVSARDYSNNEVPRPRCIWSHVA